MIFRNIKDDENIVRIGQKYFIVNNFAQKLLMLYNEYDDLQSLSNRLGYSDEKTKELYEELNSIIKNSEYLYEEMILKTPLKVQWRLTDACNLKCKHCYLGNKTANELTDLKLLSIADKIIEANIMEVTLTGGEPLLVNSLPDIIRKFLDSNILVNIFTNATLIDVLLKNISGIANKEDLKFNISIDGLRDAHENMRGKGTYNKLINSISLLTHEGFFVTTNTTLTSLNYFDIPELILEMKKIGVRTVQISNLINLGWAKENDYLKMDEEKTAIFESKMQELTYLCQDGFRFLYSPLPNEEISENPNVYQFQNGNVEAIGTDIWKCGAGAGKATISVTGEVLCCPFFNQYSIGNILEDSLENIWNNPLREDFNKYLNKVNGRKRICAALKGAYNVY